MNIPSLSERLARSLEIKPEQAQAVIDLIDAGSTIPFIARYRKEATGGLDDVILRRLEEVLMYMRELDTRRDVIIRSIQEQKKMTPELHQTLLQTEQKQSLEDLYLPYKPKRRTKGQIAKEAGLEPLALALWQHPDLDPHTQAQAYIKAKENEDDADFSTVELVLTGARDLLCEHWAEQSSVWQPLREWMWKDAFLQSTLLSSVSPEDEKAIKFRDYYQYAERIQKIPSHRALAVFRGRSQEVLSLKLALTEDEKQHHQWGAERLAKELGWQFQSRAADAFIQNALVWAWKVKFALTLERELFQRLREKAEATAIDVFGENVRDLLLAAPAGQKVVMGLDPGIRTGVKVAVVDATSKVLETATIYPFEPRKDREGALHTLKRLVEQHHVQIIAIGNGTASRETDQLVSELQRAQKGARIDQVVVSEAGASVYSASEIASKELPDLDVTLRGAVSIARRLQDPLAELVKIDPQSIGVGQYQHDLSTTGLSHKLNAVVEDCVNKVGVDLNTASVPLLSRVSGLSASVAQSIVHFREQHGAFLNRQQLLAVTGLGPKTFEQSAGFLRISKGSEPLDQTAVHPESYVIVERIMQLTGQPLQALMSSDQWQQKINIDQLVTASHGAVTIRDICLELSKPIRDPRGQWQAARFNEGVHDIKDLQTGMIVQGVISNVAQFGAFVDLGVHQDGLIHVSQMASHYVEDARTVVKVGDNVKVQVLEVDEARKRIALSMLIGEKRPACTAPALPSSLKKAPQKFQEKAAESKQAKTSMSLAFQQLKNKK